MQSLTEGIKFVFNNKTVLGYYSWYGSRSFGGAIALLPIFAQDILK
jgi:hypothetical protein